MDDLLTEFIAETREMLEALGGEIVAWEAAPGDRARLDAIFRFVHTVKGNSGFFDLPRIQALAHAAEDALAEVRAGRRGADPALVGAVLAIIDRLGELVFALEGGEAVASDDDEPLIEALSAPVCVAAAEAEGGNATIGDQRRALRSVRLSVDLLDRMMSGVSDMVLARNELARRLRDAGADPLVETAFERVSACIAEMRDAITRTRMQRIDTLFVGLPRIVRDVSAELGKQVALTIEGGDVELDREMIESIRDPLTHIVRNAVDHGIEAAPERGAAGKPPAGALAVAASQSGNQILIEVVDDGRGIDGEALAAKAVARGVVTAAEAERLSPQQKLALVFEPGLSTAREVTAISGRGVGMDVVRANIERIGGLVDLDSRPGQGLRIVLRVPLTLTIIPALTVSVGGRVFALPRAAIEEIVRSRGAGVRVETIGGARVATVRERRMPLVALADALGVPEDEAASQPVLVVLKPAGGGSYALAADAVLDNEELVIKPAAPAVMATGLYAGTTIADDGSPVLLLDPAGIAARAAIDLEVKGAVAAPAAEERSETIDALLFRTLDGRKRAVRLAVVERIEDVPAEAVEFSAGRMRVATGGLILPLAGCEARPEGKLRILRLGDGASELAYGFAEVIDIAAVPAAFQAAAAPGEVAGVTLVGDEQVEWLDTFWLFAAHAAGAAADRRPVCALALDDPWTANILRPTLESAGYAVVDASRAGEADIVIAAEDREPPAAAAGRLLRLRHRREAAGEADDSVYRYDRAGLIAALELRAASHGKN